jgi:hypothetical protein
MERAMRRTLMMALGMAVVSGSMLMALGERHKSKAPQPEIRMEGDGLEQTVHCHHNALHVLGNGSRLTIEGSCTTVFVEGSRNWMEVQDADVIDTKGSMNSVLFLNPGTRTVDRGKANTVAPKWQQ